MEQRGALLPDDLDAAIRAATARRLAREATWPRCLYCGGPYQAGVRGYCSEGCARRAYAVRVGHH